MKTYEFSADKWENIKQKKKNGEPRIKKSYLKRKTSLDILKSKLDKAEETVN